MTPPPDRAQGGLEMPSKGACDSYVTLSNGCSIRVRSFYMNVARDIRAIYFGSRRTTSASGTFLPSMTHSFSFDISVSSTSESSEVGERGVDMIFWNYAVECDFSGTIEDRSIGRTHMFPVLGIAIERSEQAQFSIIVSEGRMLLVIVSNISRAANESRLMVTVQRL